MSESKEIVSFRHNKLMNIWSQRPWQTVQDLHGFYRDGIWTPRRGSGHKASILTKKVIEVAREKSSFLKESLGVSTKEGPCPRVVCKYKTHYTFLWNFCFVLFGHFFVLLIFIFIDYVFCGTFFERGENIKLGW